MAPVRVARAFRFSITAIMTALALAGCMRTAGPVAVAPQGDLDAMTYGAAPAPVAVVDSGGGGAISALRSSFARAPGPAYDPVVVAAPVAYAEPVRYDSSYHLDAGDRLRVVVYGQEGLTNTYAIDAGGSITMPLIGAVPARGRTPAGASAAMTGKLRQRHNRANAVAVEI